jgi:PTS system nitrogen regulatory IIA component
MSGQEQKQNSENGLVDLIGRGGILSGISGNDPGEVITRIIEAVRSPDIDKKRLLDAVLEREALMPTAIGCGIALPHPRNPQIVDSNEQFVTIAFLKQPVNWSSPDGIPVHTAILIVSASPRLHLRSLSRINFFCQQDGFRSLLENRASMDDILTAIQRAEQAWNG